MSILDNILNLRTAIQMVRDEQNVAGINKTIDDAIFDGRLPVDGAIEEKRLQAGGRHARKSRLKYRTSANDGLFLSNMYQIIRDVATANDKAPQYGSSNRDDYLAKFWKTEPMLSGAVYSMSAKMGALSWSITGKSDDAKFYATMLSQAAYSFDGYDWGGFISATAEDFYTLDRGTWWEAARSGSSLYGALTALGHIDGLACWPTGNVKTPVWYQSTETGQSIKFKPGQYIHFASMPSPREEYYGLGFCAVSRALRAAKLLTGLRDYDEEKLANLPPEGVAAVSGLTMTEFKNALLLWQAERKKNKSLTFPQVLWLVGSQPNAGVDLKMIGFSQLPESFDRGDVVTQYMNTLALDFGVDVREFWPVSSSSLGTAAESEIQHMKAKGKGPGEFISVIERSLNAEFPETIHFEFDTQDIGEDKIAADVAQAWIGAFLPLTKAGAMMSSPGGSLASGSTTTPADRGDAAAQVGVGGGEQSMGIISDEQFLRLLSDKGVLPDYIVQDDRVAIMDSEVYVRKEYPMACYEWKDGVLRGKMLPPINLPSPSGVIDAEILKGGSGSGHHGHSGRPGKVGGSQSGKGDSRSMSDHNQIIEAFEDAFVDVDVEEIGKGNWAVKIPLPDHIVDELKAGGDLEGWVDEYAGKYLAIALDEMGYVDLSSDDYAIFPDLDTIKFENDGVVVEVKVYTDHDEKEYKESLKRNIRGKPIPDGEVTRGAGVTESAIKSELELWRGIHAMAQHAPHSEDEEEEIADEANSN